MIYEIYLTNKKYRIKITSILTHTAAPLIIQFIGATASSKLNVAIVGTITKIKVEMYLIAPKPTATPPKQPTIRMIKLINPKRLNSDSVTIFASNVLYS